MIEKIKATKSMKELDELRLETVTAMMENPEVNFLAIQQAFIKQKNKLRRIPWKDRIDK